MNSRNIRRNSWQTRNSTRAEAHGSPVIQSIPTFPSESKSKPRALRDPCNLLGEVYNEFAQESSIHGIKYTGRNKSIAERIFWLFLIILSVIAAGALAQKFYYRHKQANMRTLVISNQYPAWKIPLPAITICHPTVASANRLNKYMSEGNKLEMPPGLEWNHFLNDLQFLQELYIPTNHSQSAMHRLNRIVTHNNLTITEFVTIVSPSCDDYIVLCQAQGEIKPCRNYLKISTTAYGLCCSANYAHVFTEQKSSQKEYYSPNFGQSYIFSVILKSYGPNDRISGLSYGEGARVLIHDRHTYPGPSAREFIARQRCEVIASIRGRKLTASPEVLDLSEKERDCRVSGSRSNIYRHDNCLASCHEMMFRSFCHCVPFYASVVMENDTICNFSHVPCVSRVRSRILQTPFRGYPCYCLPDCSGTSYPLTTTLVHMNALQYNPSIFYRIAEKYPNATAIHVTFARQTATLMRRDLVLSWINLISSLGGVFSLFLGCSFISVVEVLYFIMYYISKVIDRRATHLPQT
ncbi:sodium channel protein Nach [Diachasma alloeum]|uniref:sodium channel protein Nach n=1 Tax=Diachasma alloeum TaxID=454923 RepID=UPI0007384773|nr:sodium channel protein Nach [Diachasma alloeum]